MTTKKEIGNLTVKQNFVKKMEIRKEIKECLNDKIQTKKRKLNLAMNTKSFQHYLQKMKEKGKEEK